MTIINKDNFENEVLKSDKLTIVDFFATWCGPCQMLAPVLEKISNENTDVNIFKVDIDQSQELAINSRVEGFRTEKELLEEINKLK